METYLQLILQKANCVLPTGDDTCIGSMLLFSKRAWKITVNHKQERKNKRMIKIKQKLYLYILAFVFSAEAKLKDEQTQLWQQ